MTDLLYKSKNIKPINHNSGMLAFRLVLDFIVLIIVGYLLNLHFFHLF
jgi:hypothetical protein